MILILKQSVCLDHPIRRLIDWTSVPQFGTHYFGLRG